VKEIWTSRVGQVAAKVGESAPAVCCGACRTCVATNVIGVATATVAAAGIGISRFLQRLAAAS
jgi:hypothetical protein